MVAHLETTRTSPAELAELMVGRKVLLEVDHTPATPGEPVLQAQDLCLTTMSGINQLKDISLVLRAGEIVGIAGVSGNGQSELLDVLSGITAPTSGFFQVGTSNITAQQPANPARLRALGVAHVPEDRHKRGIILPFSAAESMIPTSTGAAKALSLVLPKLKGKLDGTAIRVPTPNVSLIDLTFVSKKKTSPEKINSIVLQASKTKKLSGILTTNSLPLVSIDFNHNSSSSVFDMSQTQVVKDKFCRVLSWYDNEWGFSNRMVDTMVDLKKFI